MNRQDMFYEALVAALFCVLVVIVVTGFKI